MIRVLLADDQALVRHGFGMIIRSEPDMEVVAEAGTGADAADLAARLRPDVVLMDVRMPGSTASRRPGGSSSTTAARGCPCSPRSTATRSSWARCGRARAASS